ncbi:MAG: outer membrane protein [Pseudolabrys sp.]
MTRRLAKAVIAALAMLSMLGAANAGDGKPGKKPQPAPVGEWTGFYIGGNLGYGAAGLTDDAPLAITSNMTGVIGGVQAGYNYQIDRVVLGIEGDIQASGQSTSYSRTLPIVGNFTVSQRIPYFETLRGRIGYAFNCGCVMAYGTLGIAYGAYEPSASALGATVSGHYTKPALALGAGVEWMVTKGWSAKLEGLYLDTGNIGSPVNLPGVGEVHMRVRDAIMRLGLNYHF